MKPMVRPLLACTLSLIGTSALATHFITVIDPLSGQPRVLVSTGVVSAAGGTGQNNPPPLVIPTQTPTLQPSPQATPPGIQIIDPGAFVGAASPEIIQAIIRNKNAIDQENQNFLSARPSAAPAGIGQPEQPDLESLASNLYNVLNNVLHQTTQNQTGTPSSSTQAPGEGSQPNAADQFRSSALLSAAQAAEQRRELANSLSGSNGASPPDLRPDAPADNGVVAGVLMQQIANNVQEQTRPLQQALNNTLNTPTPAGAPAQPPSPELEAARQNAQDALNDLTQAATNMAIQTALQAPTRPLPGIDRTAGVDPEMERQRQQQKQQAEERKQQQLQQKEEKKQQVTNNNQQVIAQIQQSMQQLQQQNQQVVQEKQQEAMDRFQQQLTEEQRERFLRDRMQVKQEQSPDSRAGNGAPTPAAPGGVSVAGSLQQSMDELQDQNSQQTRRPESGQAPSGNNLPSNTDASPPVILALTSSDLESVTSRAEQVRLAEQRRQQAQQQEQKRQQQMKDAQQNVLSQIQQSMQQLQQQNQQAQQEKQQGAMERFQQHMTAEERERLQRDRTQAKEEQAGANSAPPSGAEAMQNALARLEAVFSQLDQLTGNQPGGNGANDMGGSQGLTQYLAQFNELYAGLIPSTGSPAGTSPGLLPGPTQLAALTQELANRTQEQSQESLKQLDEALKLATGKALDPWGSYIYVARQEHTARVPEYALNGGQMATYYGKVRGQIGDDAADGHLNLTIGFGPNTSIGGGMSLNRMVGGEVRDEFYLNIVSGGRSDSGFKGSLEGNIGHDVARGSLQGAFYGSKAQQVGGTWSISVRDEAQNLINTGGGVFAGIQHAHEN